MNKKAEFPDWTLFLDRDGVINRRLNGWVVSWRMWRWMPGIFDAFQLFEQLFGRIVVVSHQRGIALELMDEKDLAEIHNRMKTEIRQSGSRVDAIYVCPHDHDAGCNCRKPARGLALQALAAHPEIRFDRSLIIGDSATDMEFGKNLGMRTVFLGMDAREAAPPKLTDFTIQSLDELSRSLLVGLMK
jgi:D-glycero-D-manno-heptose 1,7-bisphosphate phosphatase